MRQYSVGCEDSLPSSLPQSQAQVDVTELNRISLFIEAANRQKIGLLDGQAGRP
jgi:hypothetical protein